MVVSDERGIADLEQLHSREYDNSAMLWAFDLIQLNGEDPRQLPIDEWKARIAKLPKTSRHSGITLNEHLEADGERAFGHACNLDFEGIVSKRRDSRYVSGRSRSWVKIKNPNAPGVLRFRNQDLWPDGVLRFREHITLSNRADNTGNLDGSQLQLSAAGDARVKRAI